MALFLMFGLSTLKRWLLLPQPDAETGSADSDKAGTHSPDESSNSKITVKEITISRDENDG
jgi:hypothetical protein